MKKLTQKDMKELQLALEKCVEEGRDPREITSNLVKQSAIQTYDTFAIPSTICICGEEISAYSPMNQLMDPAMAFMGNDPDKISESEALSSAVLNASSIGFSTRVSALMTPYIAEFVHGITGSCDCESRNDMFMELNADIMNSMYYKYIEVISDIHYYISDFMNSKSSKSLFITSMASSIYTDALQYLYAKGYYLDKTSLDALYDTSLDFIAKMTLVFEELDRVAVLYQPPMTAAKRIFGYEE